MLHFMMLCYFCKQNTLPDTLGRCENHHPVLVRQYGNGQYFNYCFDVTFNNCQYRLLFNCDETISLLSLYKPGLFPTNSVEVFRRIPYPLFPPEQFQQHLDRLLKLITFS